MTRSEGIPVCATVEDNPEFNPQQKDFLYLVKVLEEGHPNIHKNFPNDEFKKETQRVLQQLRHRVDEEDFLLILQQFCAHAADGHTEVFLSKILSALERFPFHVRFLKDGAYWDAVDLSMDARFIGARLLMVDGRPMEEVQRVIGSLASCENDVCRHEKLAEYLTCPRILRFMGVIADPISAKVRVLTRDGKEETLVVFAKEAKTIQWRAVEFQAHPVTRERKDWFWYRVLPEKHLCYMQFNKFMDRQSWSGIVRALGLEKHANQQEMNALPDFREFLQVMIEEMMNKNVRTWAIDLRHNGGGSSLLGYQIMYFLDSLPETFNDFQETLKVSSVFQHRYPDWFAELEKRSMEQYGRKFPVPCFYQRGEFRKERIDVIDRRTTRKGFFQNIENPKSPNYISRLNRRFQGRIILLIGPSTFSSASLFATLMRDNNFAMLIGQPISQKPSSCGERLIFDLPESKISASVSCKIFYRPDASKDKDATLNPDVEIWPSFDDLVQGRDPVFEYALRVAEEN